MWSEIILAFGDRWYSHTLSTIHHSNKNVSGSSNVRPWNVGISWRGMAFIGALTKYLQWDIAVWRFEVFAGSRPFGQIYANNLPEYLEECSLVEREWL